MSLLNKASLIQIPSGYKDGTLYSAKPTNGDGDFTFSRGSNLAATRVNSDGLIEKGRENLLLQSNQFDTTWSKNNATLTSGQSGYDGSSDAWKLESTANGGSAYISNAVSLSSIKSCSVYAKAGSYDYVIVQCGGGTASYTWFDLTNGAVGTEINVIDSKIESVGNGWYRCSITAEGTHTGGTIYAAPSNGVVSVTAGNYIYIQDSQLESGLVATDYIETGATTAQAGILEDMPRLDYSGGTTCPSLLLEPQRINYIPQSEPFSGGDWIGLSGATIVSNASVSPQGVQNAAEVQGTSGSSFIYDVLNLTASTAHTTSFYIKNNDSTTTQFWAANESAYSINWDGLTIDSVDSGVYYESVGNDWYRVWSTADSNSDGQFITRFYPSNSVASVYLYGYQVEQGSYPTSYIPTYGSGSSVTRSEDVCEVTSAEDLIGQTEGTIAGEFTFKSAEVTNRLFSISGADWNTIGHVRFDMINLRPQAKIRSTGADIAEIFGTEDIAIGSLVKFAVVYTSTTFKMFVNGAQIGSTETLSGSLPSPMNEIVVDALGGTFSSPTQNNQLNPYKQALVFKTALTDDEAIELTTI